MCHTVGAASGGEALLLCDGAVYIVAVWREMEWHGIDMSFSWTHVFGVRSSLA
jgi:hypothetical protein